MSKITRQKAAQLLGVSEQTISNYWKEGLLGGAKGKGNILYINEDDVEKYKRQIMMTHASEEAIRRKRQQLESELHELNERLSDVRTAMKCGRSVGSKGKHMAELVTNLCRCVYIPGFSRRELDVVCDFVLGSTLEDIAEKNSVTYEGARQVLARGIRRFEDSTTIYKGTKDYHALQTENEALRKEVAMLREMCGKGDGQSGDGVRPIITLLNTRIVDLRLSIRVQNCLHSQGIYTLDALLRFPKLDLMKLRNLGRKSFYEIEDLMDEYSLDWRMEGESDADFYERLDRRRKGEDF